MNLISVLALSIFFAVCGVFAYHFIASRFYARRDEEIRVYLDSIISLSISHLHDASNFFALLKSNLNDNSGSIKDSRNFARGAAYHFRALFDELKNSKSLLSNSDFDLLLKNKLNILYKKEKINLSDLLELELFQVSDFNRLELISNIAGGEAWVYGNFSLLSKALLNLVENALKYTNQAIQVELNKHHSGFEIKIRSRGEGIPERIVSDIEDSGIAGSYGHGFESIKSIMEFHEADMEIETLKGSGSMVHLLFKEYQDEEIKSQQNYYEMQSDYFSPKLLRLSIPLLLVIVIGSLSFINKFSLANDYNSRNFQVEDKIVAAVETDYAALLAKAKENSFKDFLKEEEKFLGAIDDTKRDVARLFLLRKLRVVNSLFLKAYVFENARNLYDIYPDYASLNYILSESYLQRKNIFAFIGYSTKGLISLVKFSLFPSKDLYVFDRMQREANFLNYLAEDYKAIPVKPKPIKRQIKPIAKKEAAKVKIQISKPKKISVKEPPVNLVENIIEEVKESQDSLDGLINQQDQDLGIDFDI